VDTGVSSDGGCNSSDGCMDFGSTFDGNDFTNFSSINQYINLQPKNEDGISKILLLCFLWLTIFQLLLN